MRNVLDLGQCDSDSAGSVGGKAVGLTAMIGLGLNVPPGFVVTTEGYRASVSTAMRSEIERLVGAADSPDELAAASGAIRELFTVDIVGEHLRADIVDAYDKLGSREVAVRSSATAEDLADASFAGQQDTYLWISGTESLLEHIVKCWASLFTAQVIGYRRQFGISPCDLAMAVVVQSMVPADAAGVMMTLDPATGDRAATYVEATYGLGEGVVKGDVASDSYWIAADDGTVTRSEIRTKTHAHRYVTASGRVELVPVATDARDLPSISGEEAARIAEIGRLLEASLGGPQDVEWALVGRCPDERELFLLQTRAETVWSRRSGEAAAEPVDPDEVTLLHGHAARDGLWTLTNMQEAIPGVSTPLTWSVWLPAAEFVNRNHYRFVGALSRREAMIPYRTQDWMVGTFYGRAALRIDLLAEWADRVPGMSGQDLISQFFSALPDGANSRPKRRRRSPRAMLRTPLPFLMVPRMRRNRVAVEHFWRTSIAALDTADLAQTVAILDEGVDAFTRSLALEVNLTQGAFLATSKALRKLVERTDVSVYEIVAGYGGHEETVLVEDMWSCSRGEMSLMDFLNRHGYHGWREGELSNTSWREDPTMVHSQIDAYRKRSDSEDPRALAKARSASRVALERRLLKSLPAPARPRARLVLLMSAYYLPMRGVSKVAFLQGLDVVRSAARRAGVLLAEHGDIDSPEDVFYLTLDEIRALRVPSGRRLVRERRALRQRYEAIEITDAWQGVPVAHAVSAGGETIDTIGGTPASPGIVEGRARVVLDPSDAHVERGEVLFARDTDPAWASLMFLSSALVADIGGVMSHTAVVARELGIPCVVNTKVATRHIRTGDRVRIDGAAGTVELLDRAATDAGQSPSEN